MSERFEPQYDDRSVVAGGPARRRSWFGRNWFWLVPLVCLLPVLGCGGLVALLFGMLKGSEPYQQSLRRVQGHAEVRAALGQPVEPSFVVMGSIHYRNRDGDADLTYDVSGPNGSGTVHVVADKRAGAWTLKTLDVTLHATNRRIDLLGDAAEARKTGLR